MPPAAPDPPVTIEPPCGSRQPEPAVVLGSASCSARCQGSQAQVAQLPYFVLSPNTLLSAIGLMRGPDKIRPTPKDDWRDATVDVVIPAFNEEHNVVRCLAAVLRQTRRPRRIVIVDDGSADETAA